MCWQLHGRPRPRSNNGRWWWRSHPDGGTSFLKISRSYHCTVPILVCEGFNGLLYRGMCYTRARLLPRPRIVGDCECLLLRDYGRVAESQILKALCGKGASRAVCSMVLPGVSSV